MKALLLVLALAGCVEPRYIRVPVAYHVPPRPEVPTVKAEEMECLPDDVVDRIEARDDIRRESQDELEAIIRSTQTQ